MSKGILPFLLLFFSFESYADLGASYILEVVIKTHSNEEIKGCYRYDGYDFYLHKDTDGNYTFGGTRLELEVTQQLTNGIRLQKHNDQLSAKLFSLLYKEFTLYSDIVNIPINNGHIPKLIGKKLDLKKGDIKSFAVKSIYMSAPGWGVVTELETKDKIWTKRLLREEDMSGGEYCQYTALVFNEPVPMIKDQMIQLKNLYYNYGLQDTNNDLYTKEQLDEMKLEIKDKVEILKSEGIIIMSACAC